VTFCSLDDSLEFAKGCVAASRPVVPGKLTFTTDVELPFAGSVDEAVGLLALDILLSFGVKPRSRCKILAAMLALPRSRSRFAGGCGVVVSFVFTDGDGPDPFAGAPFPVTAAADLLTALTVSWVAFSLLAFSDKGAAFTTDTFGAGFSGLVSFVSVFPDALAFFAASASLALLAFFSLMN